MLKVKDGVNGNSTTATTLQTARTINGTSFNGSSNITTANWGTARTLTIGSTGKSVNGSANVSWTLAEIGAAAASHSHSYIPLSGSTAITGTLRTSGELQSTSANAIRLVNGNYGVILRNDGTSTYLLLTASGDQYGNWNTLRPWYVNNSTGLVVFGNGLQGSLSGNATTATTLQTARTINGTSFNGSANITTANWGTARTITIGNTGKSVNGSANVSWSLSDIGALPITGGTVLGTLLVDKDLYVGENAVFKTFQAQVGQTIEIRCHLTPNTNEWWNLGQSHSMFGDIYSRRGALNGSDISFKENIKNIVENKDIMLLSENTEYDDTVTLNDLYNYVKNIDIKSFNYKKTKENILGIIANEIPENIFNKIGIINENNERVIFATAQIAMLQGALKEAINKIEELQNEIDLIKDGIN